MSQPLSYLRPSALRALGRSRCTSAVQHPPRIIMASSIVCQQHQVQRRCFADQKPHASGPNQDVLPHVSEEAAKMDEIMGNEQKVEIEEVGTPVKEMLERDGGEEKAPQVLQEEIAHDEANVSTQTSLSELADTALNSSVTASFLSSKALTKDYDIPPYLPPIPPHPIPANHHLHHRYNPLLSQLIPVFQKGGRKAKAQSIVQEILRILRTKPVPTPSPKHLLITTAPAPEAMPKNPIAYLQTAIDSVAPLLKLRSASGKGGTTVQIPHPIPVRQRRRKAIEWMMASADRKRHMLGVAERFAAEVVDVVEGRSSAWEKRQVLHKSGIVNRSNMDRTKIRGKSGGRGRV